MKKNNNTEIKMKKHIYLFLITSILILFSSCVIVAPDIRYDITFKNDTGFNVRDWYVENYDGRNFAKSDDYVPVNAYSQSTVHDLHPDFYRVRFSYFKDILYFDSNYTFLDEDIIYILSYDNFYSRAISDENADNPEKYLVLKDNKGNTYKLEKE